MGSLAPAATHAMSLQASAHGAAQPRASILKMGALWGGFSGGLVGTIRHLLLLGKTVNTAKGHNAAEGSGAFWCHHDDNFPASS